MERKIEIFKNDELGELRTIEKDGKVYFVATDVANSLGYSNPRDAIKRHCRYVVKHDVPHPQSKDKTLEINIIPEGDMYRLISHSELENAEKFEMWIFDEVLPSIRKHGMYITEELLKDKEKLQCEINKIQNEYYELEYKINSIEIDNDILRSEKEELKNNNMKMIKERKSAFKLSIKTHEKETYLPNLTIQAIRHYINNNKSAILDEDE